MPYGQHVSLQYITSHERAAFEVDDRDGHGLDRRQEKHNVAHQARNKLMPENACSRHRLGLSFNKYTATAVIVRS